MTTFEQDLQFLEAAVPELQDYLLSKELFWPLGGSLPRLTPGMFLLIQARLTASPSSRSTELESQADQVRQSWKTAWLNKVSAEIPTRIRLWSQYIDDTFSDPENDNSVYEVEVRNRVILQLLSEEDPVSPELSALDALDGMLYRRLIPGEFVWDTSLMTVFSEKTYWFLYGKI